MNHFGTAGDTIFALSSAPGRAGVAVVRVSGPDARRIGEAVAGGTGDARHARLVALRHPVDGDEIDRALVLWFPAPRSFTGEDVLELHVHGGRAVVARVFDAMRALGGRMAEPGEFAWRAFEQGKLDLTEAEGVADLIDAETEAQRRQALAQSSGALGRLYDGWRERLIEAMALSEAALDFSDEGDVAQNAQDIARTIVLRLVDTLTRHLQDGRRGEILRDGYRCVLAGAPNAGKSSLLNALAGRDVAIVSDEAGTTRDVIEVRLDLSGYPVIVADTAGVRDATGAVEQEGIRRAMAAGAEAQLLIWLYDAADPQPSPPESFRSQIVDVPVLRVANKVDLVADGCRADVAVSARTGLGLDRLVEEISARAAERLGDSEGPVITQVRHRAALEETLAHLSSYLGEDGEADFLPELKAEDLRRASVALGRITGRVDAETVLGAIFGRFCIGK